MTATLEQPSSYGFEIHPDNDNSANWRYIFYINPPKIRAISFKGGGARVQVYGKLIEEIEKRGLLHTAEEIGGSSSGSIAAIFAALHYENPADRIAALEEVRHTDSTDIYGETLPWIAYQVITYPLAMISNVIGTLGKSINWLAEKFNKILPGKLIGYPLKVIAFICGLASALTNPRHYAGLFNYIVGGGFYLGNKIEIILRDRIQQDTEAGLNAILNNATNVNRVYIAARMCEIGLCELVDGKLKVTRDVTLNHLYELSKLPGSQFKQYYTTIVRIKDGKFLVLNKDTAPDYPIYRCIRIAITFPRLYQVKKFNGEKYFDGGAIDNSPVSHATAKPVSDFKKRFGISDNMSRLSLRVEYPDEYEYHLWKQPAILAKFASLKKMAVRKFAKWLAYGIDPYATDDLITEQMQKHYSHRALQVHDFDIGLMEFDISKQTNDRIEQELPEMVDTYFQNHEGEKAVIRHYQAPTQSHSNHQAEVKHAKPMPDDVQRKLIKFLKNPVNKTENIFCFPDKSTEELELMRQSEIARLMKLDTINQDWSTADIFEKLDASPSMPSIKANETARLTDIPVMSTTVTASTNQTDSLLFRSNPTK